jgi:endonuclease/exonuclease/phosphatase family metal-dependent hydrolase
MSWNLWWRYGPWEQRQQAIAATLAEVRPDLCGFQEVWGGPGESRPAENLAIDLAARLGMHWCWVETEKVRDEAGTQLFIGNAILSRWPITAQAAGALPVSASDEPRVVVHARIDTPDGALPMFTTHLTWGLGRSALRVAQVRTLARFIQDHSTGCAYPPVVTGDFNAEPGSDELRLLGGLVTDPAVPGVVLLDSWRYADPADPGFTWDLRNPYQDDSVIPSSRIDYILVGLPWEGRGRVESVRLAGTRPVGGVWPSDHFAVVADLHQ